MIAPDEPFLRPIPKRWIPREMVTAPVLDPNEPSGPVEPHYALLINPFYPKDANASFGKHVLTPTLALSSFAATTPEHWRVEYWDENLLDGRPPFRPMPQVVGITVHLTFARRAYELADWYRARGAKVIFGGLHVLSCPDECAPHADALALGDGVQLWPRILRDIEAHNLQPRYVATYENDYCDDPSPRRSILPRRSFLTTTSLIATRGCHNRCGFCYLATDGLRMPYRMRRPQQVVDEFKADDQPYAVFIDNNLGSRRDYLHSLCDGAATARTRSGAPPLPSTSPTIPASFATWRSRDAPASSLASNRFPMTISPTRIRKRRRPPTTRDVCASCTITAFR